MNGRDVALLAATQVGISESPPNSNNVRYNTWYYGREVSGGSYPWCMVFVQWVFAQLGVALPQRTASCGALMRAAQMSGQWVTADYRTGDVVIYDFPGGAATDHCGIIESVTDSGVVAIEGNTGSGSDADGGQVQRRSRAFSVIVGAVRAKDLTEEVTEEMEERFNTVAGCPSWAESTVDKLVALGYLTGYSGKVDDQGPAGGSGSQPGYATDPGYLRPGRGIRIRHGAKAGGNASGLCRVSIFVSFCICFLHLGCSFFMLKIKSHKKKKARNPLELQAFFW